MSKEKQIEEMARITCQMYSRQYEKRCAGVGECDYKCLHYQRCEALYAVGYCKRNEVIAEFVEAVKHIADGVKFKNNTEKTAFIEMLEDLAKIKGEPK